MPSRDPCAQFYAKRVPSVAEGRGTGRVPSGRVPRALPQPQRRAPCPGQPGLAPRLSSRHLRDELPRVRLSACEAPWQPLAVTRGRCHRPGHAVCRGRRDARSRSRHTPAEAPTGGGILGARSFTGGARGEFLCGHPRLDDFLAP